MVRGITQQHTPSPAGDTSHGLAAPWPLAGEPCHFVFPREDESVQSRRARWADSAHSLALAVRGLRRRFGTQVEPQFILVAQRGASGSVDFQRESTSNQRQNTKRQIHHAPRGSKPGATTGTGERGDGPFPGVGGTIGIRLPTRSTGAGMVARICLVATALLPCCCLVYALCMPCGSHVDPIHMGATRHAQGIH